MSEETIIVSYKIIFSCHQHDADLKTHTEVYSPFRCGCVQYHKGVSLRCTRPIGHVGFHHAHKVTVDGGNNCYGRWGVDIPNNTSSTLGIPKGVLDLF